MNGLLWRSRRLWQGLAILAVLWGGAMKVVAQPVASAPKVVPPPPAREVDFASAVDKFSSKAAVAAIQFSIEGGPTLHVLINEGDTAGSPGVVYWHLAGGVGTGGLQRVKGRRDAIEVGTAAKAEVSRYDLNPISFQQGDLTVTHRVRIYTRLYDLPAALFEDSIEYRRGSQQSTLVAVGTLPCARTQSRLAVRLAARPSVAPNLLALSNPPASAPRITLGQGVHVLPGRGTVSPLAVLVRPAGAEGPALERGVLADKRDPYEYVFEPPRFPHFVMRSKPRVLGNAPTYVMKQARPATAYEFAVEADFGPVLGRVRGTAVVTSDAVINRTR